MNTISHLEGQHGLVGAVSVQVVSLHHQLAVRVQLKHTRGELKIINWPLRLRNLQHGKGEGQCFIRQLSSPKNSLTTKSSSLLQPSSSLHYLVTHQTEVLVADSEGDGLAPAVQH